MRRKTGKHQWRMDASGVAIIIGMVGIAYFSQIAPALSRHEQALAHTAELTDEQARSAGLERTLLAQTEKVHQTQRQAEQSKLTLEPAGNLNQRLARLTELAAEHRLQVDTLESGIATHSERYSTVAIRLAGRGTYRTCAQALETLRVEMPDVAVVALDMSAGTADSNATASFSFELLWHTQPQPKPVKR